MDPHRVNTPPANAGQVPAAKQIRATGRNLKRLLHGKPPRVRAQVGAKLVTGEFAYVNPTPAQAARIAECPAQLIHVALGHQPKPPSDAKLDRMIARLGPDRVLKSLDRLTQPSRVAAE